MSRPTDSFFPRVLIRPRVSDLLPDLPQTPEAREANFSSTVQQMVREVEAGMIAIQESVPVSVRDYHSLVGKGQGLVDDLQICQRAVNAIGNNGGGYLFLPKGDYFWDGSLAHTFDNVVIFGEGENTVIHQQATVLTVTIDIGSVAAGTTTGVGVRDLLIDQTPGGAAFLPVRLTRCDRVYVDRVILTGTYGTGISVQGGNFVNVSNCFSTAASGAGDMDVSVSAGVPPTNVLVMHNHFASYRTFSIGTGNNIVIRDNDPIAIPVITVNGAAQTITTDQISSAPHRYIRVQGTAGGAAETVDTLGVTYEGDTRTFIFNTTNLVTFLDVSTTGINLHLAGDFVPNAGGNEDTLTVMCDGTNWIELARSDN